MTDLKFKKGDTVKIKCKEWYEKSKDKDGRVICGNEAFIKEMARHCGCETVVKKVNEDSYDLAIDQGRYYWSPEMLEA